MLARILCLVLLGALSACTLSTAGIGPGSVGKDGESRARGFWDDAFLRRVRITFKNEGGPELTDFPVMVRLDAARIDYGAASPAGADLRFVDADGQTLLAHEIDRWSPDGESFVWVRVPKIDEASGADHMWLYYGNPDATASEDAAAVWTGFVSVYHLSPNAADPRAAVDSTGAHTGEWAGHVRDAVAGVVGDAADLNGFQFVHTGDIDDFSVNLDEARTVEVWLKPRGREEQYVVHQEGQCKGWSVGIAPDGRYTGHLTAETDAIVCGAYYNEYWVANPALIGTWHYVTLVMDRPASAMRLFVDGVLADAARIDNSADADGNGAFRIGTDWNDRHPFIGSVDEVRVSSSARSDGFIAAQHRAMTDELLQFDAE